MKQQFWMNLENLPKCYPQIQKMKDQELQGVLNVKVDTKCCIEQSHYLPLIHLWGFKWVIFIVSFGIRFCYEFLIVLLVHLLKESFGLSLLKYQIISWFKLYSCHLLNLLWSTVSRGGPWEISHCGPLSVPKILTLAKRVLVDLGYSCAYVQMLYLILGYCKAKVNIWLGEQTRSVEKV